MLKKLRNWSLYWFIRAFLAVFRLLPYRLLSTIGALLGRCAYFLAISARRRATDQLTEALHLSPAACRSTVKRLFVHFGRAAFEAIGVDQVRRAPERFVELTPRTALAFEQLKRQSRGAIFVTGHFGNWEAMAVAVAAMGYPVHTIARRAFEPRINALIEEFRNSRGVHTILRGDDQLLGKVTAAVANGGFLALFIDQDIASVRGDFVPFFGRLAYTPTGAAFFAHHLNVPVLVGGSRRLTGCRLQIDFEELHADWSDTTTATAQLTAGLEAFIRQAPEQWAWIHRRWKTRPSAPSTGEVDARGTENAATPKPPTDAALPG